MGNGVVAVGNVTEPVHCLTLSRGGRADSDCGQPDGQAKLYLLVNTKSRKNVIRMNDSVTNGNEQEQKTYTR